MHPNPHTSDYKLATMRELLFVGFDQSFDSSIQNFPYQSTTYQYSIEKNGFRAFLWLGKRVGELATYNLPYAVLCDLDWLISDHFRLAQQMAADPDLCSVPLVVFTHKGKPANKTALSAKAHGAYCPFWRPMRFRGQAGILSNAGLPQPVGV